MPLLLVDLDDTLVNRRALFRAWAQEFASAYPDQVELAAWLVVQDQQGHCPREVMWARIKKRLGLRPSVEDLVKDWQSLFAARYVLESSTREALARARESGWQLGVVTNGETTMQTAKANAMGLSQLVDGVFISESEGCRKPDRKIFERAAERCGSELAGGWMIGDNPAADIAGAHGVGLSTVWINPEHEVWPSELQTPTHTTSDIADAIEIVLG